MSPAPEWVRKAQAAEAKKAGKPRPRFIPRCSHCYIWAPTESPDQILVKCAHCTTVLSKLTLALLAPEDVKRMCGETRRSHARICVRAAR
jgi:hypothetical protein